MNNIEKNIRRLNLYPHLFEHLKGEDNPIGFVISSHLFTESLLNEQIIEVFGENSQAIIDIKLSYKQKLNLISKTNTQPDFVIGSLRKLNSLRNKLAHDINYSLSHEEIIELFMGMHEDLPYSDILENGFENGFKRYSAFIFGSMLPKQE